MHLASLALAIALLALLSPPAVAETPPLKDWEREVMSTQAFVTSHPDLRHRRSAMAALGMGHHATAQRHLLAAARLGDKPSQALLAELHFEGRGMPADRALGYAWMDVAAERGYEAFVGFRELYWTRLSDVERDDARTRGASLYDTYGDAATAPRLARALAVARRAGRLRGGTTHVEVVVPEARLQGAHFYAARFWRPADYRALQDLIWSRAGREGRVEVGDLEDVRESGPAPRD